MCFGGGRQRSQTTSASSADADVLIGHEATSSAAADAVYPVRHGLVNSCNHEPSTITAHELQDRSICTCHSFPVTCSQGMANATGCGQQCMSSIQLCCCGQVENWDHMERFWQQAVHRQALHSDDLILPAWIAGI